MKEVRNKPHVLDDELVYNCIDKYSEQREDASFFLEQCNYWKKQKLSPLQLEQVEQILASTNAMLEINKELLEILDYCKDYTIDKIMQKDEMEIALEVLTGKLPFPKK